MWIGEINAPDMNYWKVICISRQLRLMAFQQNSKLNQFFLKRATVNVFGSKMTRGVYKSTQGRKKNKKVIANFDRSIVMQDCN